MGRINKTRINLKNLDKLVKEFDKKVSIKVGILQPNGSQKHPDSDITYAELGAVHEFGATINVTDKMRRYLASQGIYLRKDTTTIVIPTRSFLRMPLLSNEGRKEIIKVVEQNLTGDMVLDRELFKNAKDLRGENLIEKIAWQIAEAAYGRVMKAFETGGFGEWQQISEFTKKRRKNPNNPPLQDDGNFKRTIEFQVEVK